MGFFGKIVKLGIDVVTSPVAVVKDVITLTPPTDSDSKIVKKLETILEDLTD